jgi:hypothetical protein
MLWHEERTQQVSDYRKPKRVSFLIKPTGDRPRRRAVSD